MEKHIYDEKNGLSYVLCGDYYLPDLVLNEEEPTYGKYGMLRKQFLKEYRSARYQYLLLTGKLNEHLYLVDAEAKETVRRLTAEFAKASGIDEKLKATDSLRWVQEMNNCKACAEEVVMESICD